MNLEQIKVAAFYDELNKLAISKKILGELVGAKLKSLPSKDIKALKNRWQDIYMGAVKQGKPQVKAKAKKVLETTEKHVSTRAGASGSMLTFPGKHPLVYKKRRAGYRDTTMDTVEFFKKDV